MSFYSLSNSKFTRHYREEVDMVFSGIDCVMNSEPAIYCSSELTTGLRLYEAFRKYNVKSVLELKEQAGESWVETNVSDVNIKSANEFASSLRHGLIERTSVITPAPFLAPGWSQPEYLAFWETLIRTRVRAVWFNRNWQFSNGCTFEFLVARDAGVSTFDSSGHDLDLRAGIELVETATQQLESSGFDTIKLRENLRFLHKL